VRWPGKIEPNQVINGVMSGMDWFPTFVTAAGNPNVREELLEGKTLNGKDYKVHLDGYDQTDMLTKGGESARDVFWYFTQSDLSAARVNDTKYLLKYQPDGWLGNTVEVNFPMLYNLRLDPFEKMGYSPNESLFAFKDYYTRNMWRFVYLQQKVEALAQSAVEYPPMQHAASLNLDAVKKQVAEAKHSIAQ
jgi:arylsulfatase